ncbi:MAG: hypothetical protein H0X53_02205 [Sphingomonas sp.]|nr:hypothetical protein [Sphingomonas sp.]
MASGRASCYREKNPNARYTAQTAAESENVLHRRLAIVALLVAGAVATAAVNNVSKSASAADVAAAQALLRQARVHSRPSDFAAEVKAIAAIQRQILAAAPIDKDIAVDRPRELTDMLQLGHGLRRSSTSQASLLAMLRSTPSRRTVPHPSRHLLHPALAHTL